MQTSAPARASSIAHPCPISRAPPVISAVLPCKENNGFAAAEYIARGTGKHARAGRILARSAMELFLAPLDQICRSNTLT